MVGLCVSAALAALLMSAAETPGTLVVASDPPGAAVYVDGQFVGETPLDVRNLPPGDHRVRLVHSVGFEVEAIKAHTESTEGRVVSCGHPITELVPKRSNLSVFRQPASHEVVGTILVRIQFAMDRIHEDRFI